MSEATFHSSSEEETMALGARIAQKGYPGMFVALYGGLGAGKTVFARGFAGEMGIEGLYSPTFTIVCEHEGLLHFDAYRLSSAAELYDIGFEDYLERGQRILMEWPENVIGALPDERIDVYLEGSGDAERIIRMIPHGERAAEIVREALL